MADKIVYEHTTGVAYLLDESTGTIKKALDMSPQQVVSTDGEYKVTIQPNDRALLKNADGKYRTEVRNECKRLFFQGVSVREISTRTGVNFNALNQWVYGTDRNGSSFKCWTHERKRFVEEGRKANLERYVGVEKDVLSRMQEFLQSKDSKIRSSRELRDFSDSLAKILYVPGGMAQGSAGGNNKTQINITTNNVVPLTPDEARNILVADPIRFKPLPPAKEIENEVEEASFSPPATDSNIA